MSRIRLKVKSPPSSSWHRAVNSDTGSTETEPPGVTS